MNMLANIMVGVGAFLHLVFMPLEPLFWDHPVGVLVCELPPEVLH